MKPIIGLSIKESNLKDFSMAENDYDAYEFRDNSKDRQNIKKIIKRVKEPFKGKALSIHSNLGLIFSCERHGFPEFKKAEVNIFKEDIIAAKIIGADRINFHIDSRIFTKKEKKIFHEIVEFAEENKIKLIVESNVDSNSEYILDFLETFPKINYCLDFGHLNTSLNSGKFKMDLFEFLNKFNKRIIHVHAHNNFGEKDEHNSLDRGIFPWKEVLNKLTHIERIICENLDYQEAKKKQRITRRILSLKSKFPKNLYKQSSP